MDHYILFNVTVMFNFNVFWVNDMFACEASFYIK